MKKNDIKVNESLLEKLTKEQLENKPWLWESHEQKQRRYDYNFKHGKPLMSVEEFESYFPEYYKK